MDEAERKLYGVDLVVRLQRIKCKSGGGWKLFQSGVPSEKRVEDAAKVQDEYVEDLMEPQQWFWLCCVEDAKVCLIC